MSALSSRKIFLTGKPGCGKTTLIKHVVESLGIPVYGFYTGEIQKQGKRVGFSIETFSRPSQKGILSHIDIKSKHRVGKYGVDIKAFEKIALPEIEMGLKQDSLIVIDEIGKMELFSVHFRELLIELCQSQRSLLATILYKSHPFCDKLKSHKAIEIITVNNDNRDKLVNKLASLFT